MDPRRPELGSSKCWVDVRGKGGQGFRRWAAGGVPKGPKDCVDGSVRMDTTVRIECWSGGSGMSSWIQTTFGTAV